MRNTHTLIKNFLGALADGRVPGRVQRIYFDLVSALGFKTLKVRTRDGYILSYLSRTRTIYVEIWQKHDYDFDDFNFEEGAVVVDIGANQGLFSVYAARNGALVYAFEPLTENLTILEENVSQNGMDNQVNIHKLAVTGNSYEADLFFGMGQGGDIISGSASIVDNNRGGKIHATRKVKGIPINELLEFCSLTQCDFLKIDCEGGEYNIFDNISVDNLRKFDRISLEFHRGDSDTICEKLKRAGFKILRQDKDESGLIKAQLLK